MIARKLMHVYWRATRSHTLGAQAVVFDTAGRVLLVRHTYHPGWHFPGGGVERNESARDAVVRELREEAGVVCGSTPRLFAIYTNFKSLASDHICLYLIDAWSQPVPPKPNHEIAEHGFFAPDALPPETRPAVSRRLDEIRNELEPHHEW